MPQSNTYPLAAYAAPLTQGDLTYSVAEMTATVEYAKKDVVVKNDLPKVLNNLNCKDITSSVNTATGQTTYTLHYVNVNVYLTLNKADPSPDQKNATVEIRFFPRKCAENPECMSDLQTILASANQYSTGKKLRAHETLLEIQTIASIENLIIEMDKRSITTKKSGNKPDKVCLGIRGRNGFVVIRELPKAYAAADTQTQILVQIGDVNDFVLETSMTKHLPTIYRRPSSSKVNATNTLNDTHKFLLELLYHCGSHVKRIEYLKRLGRGARIKLAPYIEEMQPIVFSKDAIETVIDNVLSLE